MTGIVTRSHRVNCRRCKHLPKEKLCYNVVSGKQMHEKIVKPRTRGVYNEKEEKVLGSKKELCQEVDKQRLQKGKHSEAYDSVKDNLRERPTISVYKRITRANSKCMSGTETSTDIKDDAACKDIRINTRGKKSGRQAKRHELHKGENHLVADVEFVQRDQDRMIDVRMTRSKKNMLLQMQANEENAGNECIHDHTNKESCLVDSDKNPILTYNHTLQRKRKRMSVMMYGEGLEDSYHISGKGICSETYTKKEIPFRAMTRNAIHKQNTSAIMNAQTLQMDKQYNVDLQNHGKDQEQPKVTLHSQLQDKLSTPGQLAGSAKITMQNDEIALGSKDPQSCNKTPRKTENAHVRKTVNPDKASDVYPKAKLRENVEKRTAADSGKAKVIAMACIPKRVTRSMQKASVDLDQVLTNDKPVVTCKKKHKDDPLMGLRTRSQPSSFTEACREEKQLTGESHVEDKNNLKNNSKDPAINRSSNLEDRDQHIEDRDQDNSDSYIVSGKLNLSESIKGIKDLEGKGHLHRTSKRKEKQKYELPRKEYLTRSKHDKRIIQEDKEKHLAAKVDICTTPCNTDMLNSSVKRTGDSDSQPPIDEPSVLLPKESAKDNSVRPSATDIDSGDHLSLKRKGEVKPSLHGTLDMEHTERSPTGTHLSSPSREQIRNDTITETWGCSNAAGEIPSKNLLFVTKIEQAEIKSGDLAGSNIQPTEMNACAGFDGKTCLESERQTGENTFISMNKFERVEKSCKGGLDEHDCMEGDHFVADVKKKCARIMNNTNDLGMRQMRPRRLDPLQPLPVFIEGRDEEFYEFDSVSFQWHPTQHEEEKVGNSTVDNASASQSEHKSSSLKSQKQEIKIPSYKTVPDYDEVRRSLTGGKSIYSTPGPCIRHIEISAKDQMKASEYDIEDDDEEWLKNFNKRIADRKPLLQLTEDKFEELIEYFEKESANVSADKSVKVYSKNSLRDLKDKLNPVCDMKKEKVPTSDGTMQELEQTWGKASSILSSVPQTSDCCICNGGENSTSNPVYRCKSCGIYVHQTCYGIHDHSDGSHEEKLQISDWVCRKCEVFGSANVHICCAICCKSGGALKPTTNPAKWAHVVCALYTNETFFLDTDSMEPIDGVFAAEMRSRRQKRLCCFCGARVGSCECCSVDGCEVMFHISCGVNRGAYFELQHNNQQVVNVSSFCPRHANMALKDNSLKNKEDKVDKSRDNSHLQSLPTTLNTDETNLSQQGNDDDGQLENTLLQSNNVYQGFIEEGSNVKDACHIPLNDDVSVPKRPGRRKLRHRFKSAVKLSRFKSASRNKMILLGNGLHSQSSANSRSLHLTSTSQQQQGPWGGDEGNGLGKLNANVSDTDSNQFIKLKNVLKAKIGPPFVVREVYSYWLSKRAKKKGPLLQRLQQEATVIAHDIFNRDSAGIREYFGLKEDYPINFKMVLQKLTGLERDLKSVRSIAKLIIDREKIKSQLCSGFQELAAMKLFALQKELGLMSCFHCKSSENLLHCAQCKRIFCFQCYKHWKVHGLKSYRIESCRKCFCKGCEVACKTDSVDSTVEKSSMKSQREDSERFVQVPNGLGQSSKTSVKPDGECGTERLEVKNAPFSTSITSGVCLLPKHEVAENTNSKADTFVIPNMQETNNAGNFLLFTADTGSSREINGHPLDDIGRLRSTCRTVRLSELPDVVSLNNDSLSKSTSTDCHNNVQKTRYKRRKLERFDPIPISLI